MTLNPDIERHLDGIAAAYQDAAKTIRELLAPLGEDVLPLESKLRATIAMAEVAAAIGLARGLPEADRRRAAVEFSARRCNAEKDGKRCLRAIALDKMSICEGPHDFGAQASNVFELRPRPALAPTSSD